MLADPLARTAREEMCLANFWEWYLPNGRVFPSQAGEYSSGGWTNVVQRLYPGNEILRLALLANGYSSLGQRDGDEALVKKGIEAYGHALNGLGRALAVQARGIGTGLNEGTVVAVRLMIMYSVC